MMGREFLNINNQNDKEDMEAPPYGGYLPCGFAKRAENKFHIKIVISAMARKR